MGDVDVAARVRRVFGLILLAFAAVTLVLFGIAARFLPDLVALDLYGPLPVVALCVAFVAGALPLLIPQREPPTDPRHNRWYIAFGLWATTIQLVCMLGGYGRAEHETLAESTDGARSVPVGVVGQGGHGPDRRCDRRSRRVLVGALRGPRHRRADIGVHHFRPFPARDQDPAGPPVGAAARSHPPVHYRSTFAMMFSAYHSRCLIFAASGSVSAPLM
jgi:hypothetical protein